jgi:hypothetical protein
MCAARRECPVAARRREALDARNRRSAYIVPAFFGKSFGQGQITGKPALCVHVHVYPAVSV